MFNPAELNKANKIKFLIREIFLTGDWPEVPLLFSYELSYLLYDK